MKAMTQQELNNFVQHFSQVLEGAQLQEVIANDRGLALSFHNRTQFWMVLDLVPNTPMMLVFENHCPFKKGPKPKPVGLFLNSNAKNLYVAEFKALNQYGRVAVLTLANTSIQCELEIRLIPKQCNLVVRAQGKTIAWERPMDLKEAPAVENPPEPRSLVQLHEEWLSEQKQDKKPSLDPVAQWEKQRQKDLEKKRKALDEIQKQIDNDKHLEWQEVGNFLVAHRSIEVPEHLKPYVNARESLSWNIETAFSKAKQLVAKKDGARDRLAELQKEIAQLEKSQYREKQSAKPGLVDLMHKADARGRKFTLNSGALAYCGKSAADNLALLRQAKAWDYWLHLKDYPGAHAIIHRQRDQEISQADIQEVASWVARESLSSKSLMVGQKVAVVMVECRFVRPIKGDKLGRVTYHSEKTFHFTLRQS
ncbi:DUF814 domain-containing protein [Bdellovibrio sp. SKB1291214]|uniref:DUF814 domain-containing protein n=1 Tax=Bdellovibrio sp. SKB1291214 TaxID=1732569 RepID=UPI000B514C33|nr:DUF814 domain-containing protein [Bdellovibrio sp. SKB1291214]UYL09780.1 DUF814 domain-containing protein [Bdellovibrio sp. SKB1291214]